jgi:hypothetical protein
MVSQQRFTWTAGVSWSPAIAMDSFGWVYVVWREE